MADGWMGPIELLLLFGLAIGLAVRELAILRRDEAAARRHAHDEAHRAVTGSTPAPGAADAQTK